MDVALTAEQVQWQEAVARLGLDHAVAHAADLDAGPDPRGWEAVLALGIPALRSPALCGVEAAGVESVLAVERVARHLSRLPVLGQAVIAPELLAAAGADDLLGEVAEGAIRLAPALSADLARFGQLGEPAVAVDAAGSTHALLLDGPGIVAVRLGSRRHESLDLTRVMVPISADATRADLAVGGPVQRDRLVRAEAVALTAFAADLLGVMEGAVDEAVAYAKERRQFGSPIGSFQAVQHLLADALVLTEGARSAGLHAAWAIDHLDADDALLAARTAKASCAASGLRVVEITVQVFGGIAITWEHLAHVRLRRVHLARRCLGAEDVQHRAIASTRMKLEDPSS